MPKIAYEKWRPGPEAIEAVVHANRIAADFRSQGYDLTLRQMYYQFVAHDLFPADRTFLQVGSKWVRSADGTPNAEPNYKWLGDIISKARLAGLLDWNYIVDRHRSLEGYFTHFPTVEEMVEDLADGFFVDLWEGQETYVEVWVEKDALSGIVGRAAAGFRVATFAAKGYPSSSSLWQAGRRLLPKVMEGRAVTILHLGDHDPSGIDMTRDIRDRLALFTEQDFLNDHFTGVDADEDGTIRVGRTAIQHAMAEAAGLNPFAGEEAIVVKRIALNMDQIEEYAPPPNPAKMTDSRATDYVAAFGDESWELDALSPAVLGDLIQEEIRPLIDWSLWEERRAEQDAGRARLQSIVDRFQEGG